MFRIYFQWMNVIKLRHSNY